MAEVVVTGVTFIVDDEDISVIEAHAWRVAKSGSHYRLTRQEGSGARCRNIYFCRQILGEPEGVVDHADGNSLDNRKANLRVCTHSQNSQNRATWSAAGYKGVTRNKRLFEARIKAGSRRLHLGLHQTAEDAARAYDAAAREHFGEFAALNFPDHGERSAIPRRHDHG